MELKTNKATPFQVTKDALNRLSLLKEYEKGKYLESMLQAEVVLASNMDLNLMSLIEMKIHS